MFISNYYLLVCFSLGACRLSYALTNLERAIDAGSKKE